MTNCTSAARIQAENLSLLNRLHECQGQRDILCKEIYRHTFWLQKWYMSKFIKQVHCKPFLPQRYHNSKNINFFIILIFNIFQYNVCTFIDYIVCTVCSKTKIHIFSFLDRWILRCLGALRKLPWVGLGHLV